MGCLVSGPMEMPSREIGIEDVFFDVPAHRKVTEYPFYEGRLKEIDW